MNKPVLIVVAVGCIAFFCRRTIAAEQDVRLTPKIAAYINARIAEFDQISNVRKAQLEGLARYVESRKSLGQTAKLTFICTHNSRRSHMSQLWAAAAAAHYSLDNVETYSGGTESTAFNPRAIAALQRAGFEFTRHGEAASGGTLAVATAPADGNTPYDVTFASNIEPVECFSKRFDSDSNPTSNFCAVMTCAEAGKSCPIVEGAALRIEISFDDPKVADGTPQEAATYDERCAQIAREMLFVFSLVK